MNAKIELPNTVIDPDSPWRIEAQWGGVWIPTSITSERFTEAWTVMNCLIKSDYGFSAFRIVKFFN
jgi:hypothetical protein